MIFFIFQSTNLTSSTCTFYNILLKLDEILFFIRVCCILNCRTVSMEFRFTFNIVILQTLKGLNLFFRLKHLYISSIWVSLVCVRIIITCKAFLLNILLSNYAGRWRYSLIISRSLLYFWFIIISTTMFFKQLSFLVLSARNCFWSLWDFKLVYILFFSKLLCNLI